MVGTVSPIGTAILIAIIVVPIYLIYRYRTSSWSGVVTDKRITEGADDDGDTTYSYHLQIKKDGAAKAHDHSVSGETYGRFSPGDKIAKKAGKMGLIKV